MNDRRTGGDCGRQNGKVIKLWTKLLLTDCAVMEQMSLWCREHTQCHKEFFNLHIIALWISLRMEKTLCFAFFPWNKCFIFLCNQTLCLSVVILSKHISERPQGVTGPARLTADPPSELFSNYFGSYEKTTNRETELS